MNEFRYKSIYLSSRIEPSGGLLKKRFILVCRDALRRKKKARLNLVSIECSPADRRNIAQFTVLNRKLAPFDALRRKLADFTALIRKLAQIAADRRNLAQFTMFAIGNISQLI